MVGVFGVFLPALVFAMLTGLWLIRMLADMAVSHALISL
jgi:hypothetical protein